MKKIIFISTTILIVVVGVILFSSKINKFNDNTLPTENDQSIKNLQYKVGDVILSDGRVVKIADYAKIDENNLPVALIGGLNSDGNTFAIGLHISDTSISWATDNSMGYVTNFKDLIVEQTNNENAIKATFSGNLNGKDSLSTILTIDKEDTENLQSNYPAFYFASTYAEKYKLIGEYSSDWYIPSIAELCIIYKNRESINNSLQKIYKLDNNLAINELGTNWYWSSSQAKKQDDYAWFVHFVNGYAGECPKNFTNLHTLVIHEFLGDKQ